MKSLDEFDFMDGLPRRRATISPAERAALLRLGLLSVDVDAIEHLIPLLPIGDDERSQVRRACMEAMLHYRLHGVKILDGLNLCFDEILGRSYPATVGADSIFGKARCDVEGFEINNDLRPFYVRILAAKRPEGFHRITLCDSWADFLIVAGWPPIVTGEEA